MLSYFDKVFIRTSNQYVKWKDQGSSDLAAILLLSLFQCINVLSIIFFVGGLLYGRDWLFTKVEIIIVQLAVLVFDYIRIYRVIGFKKISDRYSTEESRKLTLTPLVYFFISIAILVMLRLVGFYPDIQ